jgi:hypothetical protein
MPCFVIVSSAQRDKPIDAVMCDSTITGYPDRKSDVPIKITAIEDSLTIEGELRPRSIISCTGMNGTITYLVDGSTAALRNRERRVALAKALSMLNQLRDVLVPLIESSEGEHDGLAGEGMGQIYGWIAEERERLTAAPSSTNAGNDDAKAS